MSQHTPGPWMAEKNEADSCHSIWPSVRVKADFVRIADVHSYRAQEGKDVILVDERAANARLIAAAPDLLAALKQALMVMKSVAATHGYDTSIGAVPEAQAAIAKAEGQ